jgi:dTDP-4-amino-4,6-dideoxygalactose transaminase
MTVPLLDVRRQNAPLAGELMAAFERVLRSGEYILGAEMEAFERAAAAVAGARHGIAVSSGTDAILLALMALDIGAGDEVICPAFTFFATAGCIARAGARPVFVDSCPWCFNIDPAGIERSITPRTRAVIPVHLFGQMAHMDEVMDIARRHNLSVIEDAAQALGTVYRQRPAGSLGAFGAFSFYPSKNLGGFGDAGLLVTSDDALAARARLLRCHGGERRYFHRLVGGNFRMDALQAALLAVKLPHLEEYSRRRAGHAAAYTASLASLPGAAGRAVSIILPAPHPGHGHIWNQYTLRVVRGPLWSLPESPRDTLKRALDAQGIGSEIYYPCPMHQQECFRGFGPHAPLPVCEQLAMECLSIPVFPELTAGERECVVTAMAGFLHSPLGAR